MHAVEESDRAVVLMNQPNNEGQPSAEVGEGRVRTKENIVASFTGPTQSGEPVSHGMERCARRSSCFFLVIHPR